MTATTLNSNCQADAEHACTMLRAALAGYDVDVFTTSDPTLGTTVVADCGPAWAQLVLNRVCGPLDVLSLLYDEDGGRYISKGGGDLARHVDRVAAHLRDWTAPAAEYARLGHKRPRIEGNSPLRGGA